MTYRVALDEINLSDLPARIEAFLAADSVVVQREKKGRSMTLDLRPNVIAISCDPQQSALLLCLRKGSPLPVAAQLLELAPEDVRNLDVRKIDVSLATPDEPA